MSRYLQLACIAAAAGSARTGSRGPLRRAVLAQLRTHSHLHEEALSYASLLADLAGHPQPLQRRPPLSSRRTEGPDGKLLWSWEREGSPEAAAQSAEEFIQDRVVQGVLERRSVMRVARRAARRHSELTGTPMLAGEAREALIAQAICARTQIDPGQLVLVATSRPWQAYHGERVVAQRLTELRWRSVGWVGLLTSALTPVRAHSWGWKIHADLREALGGGSLEWRVRPRPRWGEELLPLRTAALLRRAGRCTSEPVLLPREVGEALTGPGGGELLSLIQELGRSSAPWRESPEARQSRMEEVALAALGAWEP